MEQEDRSNRPGGNRVFEDYGSNYGSYGDEDEYYEDLVGVDNLDDDFHYQREPTEKPSKDKPTMEYQVKQSDDNANKPAKEEQKGGNYNQQRYPEKQPTKGGWDSKGGWDGREQRKEYRDKYDKQDRHHNNTRGKGYDHRQQGYDDRRGDNRRDGYDNRRREYDPRQFDDRQMNQRMRGGYDRDFDR